MNPIERRALRAFLAEDLGAQGDVTSRTLLSPRHRITALLVANDAGIVAGLPYVAALFRLVDRRARVRLLAREGSAVRRGQRIAYVRGPALAILAAERTALNLLGHLSGIATLTRQFTARVRGTRAAIYDTRKTLPGLRSFEKYAVRIGGGRNHRMSLSDQLLIKTNHLRILGGLRAPSARRALIAACRARHGLVEVEVTDAEELLLALLAHADIILLDNMPPSAIRRAVRLRHLLRPTTRLEVSGGVTLTNIRAIAQTGVDRISVGALTKSASSLDFALRVRSSG